MTAGLLRPCLVCGEPSEDTRCEEHSHPEALRARGTPEDRGYDAQWRRLSRRARRRQNFCTRCQSTRNLSTDHTPEAWWRKTNGLPVRLRDVQVLCARCQSEVGSSRPGTPRYEKWEANRGAKMSR